MYHKRLRKIVVLYIVVRLSDRGDMESFDFEGFNIQGLNIDGHRYLDGFYVLSVAQEIDASQMAKRTEQTALFNVIEFDAYGQNFDVPNDIFNSTGTTLLAQNNYWGELPPPCPPLPNQISGTVTTSPCLGSPPGGLAVFRELPPLAAAAFGAPSAGASPDLDTEVKQRLIAQYKATISSSPASPEAVEAVRAYYSLVRTDRQDKLKERSQAAGYLQGLASAHASLPLGHSALQLLIIEKHRTGDLSGAIALSQEALTKLPEQEQSGVLFNLVWLTLSAGEVAQAQQLVADFRARFPELASEAAHLEETVAEMAPELASMGSSRVMAGKTALPANPGTATARQAPLDELRCFLGFACPRITYNTKASGFAGMRGITR